MKVTVYGIPNCNSVKAALTFYKNHGAEVTLHNYDKDGLTEDLLAKIISFNGAASAINTRSPTFRNLDDASKELVKEAVVADAKELTADQKKVLLANNRLLKRPVVQKDDSSEYKVEAVADYK